jgi:transposase
MWLKYTEQIAESVEELLRWERRLRGHGMADRVKMLRLLKTGEARSRRRLVELLGYCERHLQRWWRVYQRGGLAALVVQRPRGGRRERMTPQAWQSLSAAMEAGQMGGLREVQQHLRKRCGIRYRGVSGVSRLLKRHGVKLKTGRRQHRKAELGQQAAFKKGLRRVVRTARG